MVNATSSTTLTGVTSWTYHLVMWILVTAGILANIAVIVLRCSRKESRLNLLSLLFISLAVADLCFCCHFLLQEVMLAYPVFGAANRNDTFHVTNTDERLCLAVAFFAYVSASAISLTVVAIALHCVLSLHLCRYRHLLVTGFVSLLWIACFLFGISAVSSFRHYNSLPKSDLDLEKFSLVIIFKCVAAGSHQTDQYPLVLTTVNAVSSLLVIVIYACLWFKLRNINSNSRTTESQEITHVRIRLTVISVLNLVCWWPLCILHWYALATKKSVFDGTISPAVSEPFFVFGAVVSVANPIIYSFTSKNFFRTRHMCLCCFSCRCSHEEQTLLLPGHGITMRNFNCGCCGLFRRLLPGKKNSCTIRYRETLTEDTEDTSLFSEYERSEPRFLQQLVYSETSEEIQITEENVQ